MEALSDTAAHAEEILTLNVEDLDLEFRRARVVSEGRAIEYVHRATPTTRLLPVCWPAAPAGRCS